MKLFSNFGAIIEKRRVICKTCEHNKANELGIKACSLCGCPIESKTSTPGVKCADNPPRW